MEAVWRLYTPGNGILTYKFHFLSFFLSFFLLLTKRFRICTGCTRKLWVSRIARPCGKNLLSADASLRVRLSHKFVFRLQLVEDVRKAYSHLLYTFRAKTTCILKQGEIEGLILVDEMREVLFLFF